MIWDHDQQNVIGFVKNNHGEWKNIKAWERWKCNTCHTIIKASQLGTKDKLPCCPACGETFLEQVCPLDHCHCQDVVPIGHFEYCPVCGKGICPNCGTHDVAQISRVTGYYQLVDGFNEGKKQEVKDRHRTGMEELK